MRRIVQRGFTPRSIRALEQRLRARAEAIVGAARARSGPVGCARPGFNGVKEPRVMAG
ncbi:hypothetical protein [Streptomyces eurythermus]|uniref:hypothetical protein n=1 Tax=Streptomyces eurythermus TaxID=42237 RepID=UPI0036F59212